MAACKPSNGPSPLWCSARGLLLSALLMTHVKNRIEHEAADHSTGLSAERALAEPTEKDGTHAIVVRGLRGAQKQSANQAFERQEEAQNPSPSAVEALLAEECQ